MGFIQKSINPEGGLGRDLLELRTKAGLSLAEAARLSKVSEGSIRALEEERWDEIPDPIYFEHVFRTYLALFPIQQNYYLQKYRASLKIQSRERTTQELLPRERVRWFDLTVWSRVVAVLGLCLFASLIGGYVFFQVRAVTAPPLLLVEKPLEGERLAQPIAEIQGKTESDAAVSINGRSAIVENDGTFKLTIDIPSGPTVIIIQAKKRRGKTAEETRHVFYQRTMDAP
jgi:cytoskeletal protein RodZ